MKEAVRVGQIDLGQDNRSALRDRTTVFHPHCQGEKREGDRNMQREKKQRAKDN